MASKHKKDTMANAPYDWRNFDAPQFFTRAPLEEKVWVSDISLDTGVHLSSLGPIKVDPERAQKFYDALLGAPIRKYTL